MTKNWHESWEAGRIGFHQESTHPDLVRYEHLFLETKLHTVLVPLCGKTIDLIWLAEKGHQVIGIELVPQAVEDFFKENQLDFEKSSQLGHTYYRSKNITIYCADIFDIGQDILSKVDRIWDRAALVALPKDVRKKYSQHLQQVVCPDSTMLLNVFEYDTTKMDGPPFSISNDEVAQHYAKCQINLLEEKDTNSPFSKSGHSYWHVRSYLLNLPK